MINLIANDIKQAMRDKNKGLLNVLRSLKSALKNQEIELKRELKKSESLEIIVKAVKSREQSLELYIQGNREDLAEIERKEIEIIKAYLPKSLTKAEIQAEIEQAIPLLQIESMKDMGKLMKHLKEKIGARADGKTLSSLVRSKLMK